MKRILESSEAKSIRQSMRRLERDGTEGRGGLALPRILADVAALVAGAYRRILPI